MRQQGELIIVDNPSEAAELLNELMVLPGAFLKFDEDSDNAFPVKVDCAADDEKNLAIEISSSSGWPAELVAGKEFFLLAHSRGKLIKSALLSVISCRESRGRLICYCPCPETFEVLQRRGAFRAGLDFGLQCGVKLQRAGSGQLLFGVLKDLSLSGALVALPLDCAALLDPDKRDVHLSMCFQDGTVFSLDGVFKHYFLDYGRRLLRVGLEFKANTVEQERTLTYFVREIERESARRSGDEGERFYHPSPLFPWPADEKLKDFFPPLVEYPSPMARRLSALAEFVASQALALKLGGRIDSVQLSHQGDRLLSLLETDREGVFFALHCLSNYPLLVRHSLSVAVRLVDFIKARFPSRVDLKAVAASAMVHELWRCLDAPQAGGGDRARQGLLLDRLAHCGWLSAEIAAAVVRSTNGQADGNGAKTGQLAELQQRAAIVDAVDALCRGFWGGAVLPIDQVYRQMLKAEADYAPELVKEYVRRFGVLPVGTLLRYPEHSLAWVLRVDPRGLPCQLQLTVSPTPPGKSTLGSLLGESETKALGQPVEIIAVLD